MKGHLNTQLLATTKVQSASIGVLGTILHPLVEPGVYRGTVLRGNAEVLELAINVDDTLAADQVDIDVARSRSPLGAERRDVTLGMRPGGHLILYASSGPADAYVLVRKQVAEGEKPREGAEFDSRRLHANDLFAVALLRPGLYSVSDALGLGSGCIRVMYPTIGDAPTSLEPVLAKVRKGTIDPAELTIRPAQPVVFTIESGESAIAVRLEKPEDGPKGKEDERRARRLERWKRPENKT